MTRKQIVIVVALTAFVGVIVVAGLISKKEKLSVLTGGGEDIPVASKSLLETKDFSPEVPKGAVETKPDSQTALVNEQGETQGMLGRYRVVASSRGYEPVSLTVRENNIIEFTLFSDGGKFDFFIPALGVHVSADEGSEISTSFRAGASGTFLFECRDFCPRSGKIQGTLVVMPKE